MPFNYDATWEEQASAPSTPGTGKWKLFPKSDGFYALDDGGTEYGPFSSETVVLLAAATELTISAGSVTVTQSHHTIDTESDAASDDLDTILGGQAGELLYIRAENAARTVVVRHGTGNIVTPSGNDVTLESLDAYLLLIYDGTNSQWSVVSESAGFANPMTGTGDMIYSADGSGTPARLAAGNDGEVLKLSGGVPVWATEGAGSGGYTEGTRVYHSSAASIAHNTTTALTFDSERYDTDTIHSTGTNTGRLTCQTAGKYLIAGTVRFDANTTGIRQVKIRLNGTTDIGNVVVNATTAGGAALEVATIYDLSVSDYVELLVYQSSGGALDVTTSPNASPEFMMQRIG